MCVAVCVLCFLLFNACSHLQTEDGYHVFWLKAEVAHSDCVPYCVGQSLSLVPGSYEFRLCERWA